MSHDPQILKIQQDLVDILSCPCPCAGTVGPGCDWRGLVHHVLPHLIINHQDICYLDGEETVLLVVEVNHPQSSDWMMVQTCHGQSFLVTLQKRVLSGEMKLLAQVQLLGAREVARKFLYSLELRKSHRTITVTSTPRGIRENPLLGDGLEVSWRQLKHFVTQGVIALNISVHKKK